MSRERWNRIGELFDAALVLAPEDREAFLQDACRGDAQLMEEVRSLLQAYARLGAFLEPGRAGARTPKDPEGR